MLIKNEFNIPGTIAGQIVKYLSDAIISGSLKFGEKIIENQLKEKLGVSRSPIREALRILESQDLVENIPRKGTYVKRITVEDFKDNMIIRAELEGLAARLAVPYLKDAEINNLQNILSRMSVITSMNKPEEFANLHFRWHDIFIRASQNRQLIDIITKLRKKYEFIRIHLLYYPERTKRIVGWHEAILSSFIKKDPVLAGALAKDHILQINDKETFEKFENFISEYGG